MDKKHENQFEKYKKILEDSDYSWKKLSLEELSEKYLQAVESGNQELIDFYINAIHLKSIEQVKTLSEKDDVNNITQEDFSSWFEESLKYVEELNNPKSDNKDFIPTKAKKKKRS